MRERFPSPSSVARICSGSAEADSAAPGLVPKLDGRGEFCRPAPSSNIRCGEVALQSKDQCATEGQWATVHKGCRAAACSELCPPALPCGRALHACPDTTSAELSTLLAKQDLLGPQHVSAHCACRRPKERWAFARQGLRSGLQGPAAGARTMARLFRKAGTTPVSVLMLPGDSSPPVSPCIGRHSASAACASRGVVLRCLATLRVLILCDALPHLVEGPPPRLQVHRAHNG